MYGKSEPASECFAETEFEKYRIIQDREYLSDYDKYLLELEEQMKNKPEKDH